MLEFEWHDDQLASKYKPTACGVTKGVVRGRIACTSFETDPFFPIKHEDALLAVHAEPIPFLYRDSIPNAKYCIPVFIVIRYNIKIIFRNRVAHVNTQQVIVSTVKPAVQLLSTCVPYIFQVNYKTTSAEVYV